MNQILCRYRSRGMTERLPMEPSKYYNNVPSWRWRITESGAAFLAAGMAEGVRAVRRAEQARAAADRAAKRLLRENLVTQAYMDNDPSVVPACEREQVIRELRAAGSTLDEIGQVFGITRERVRQILVGYRSGRCRCPEHDPRTPTAKAELTVTRG